MNNQNDWKLILRYLSGQITSKEDEDRINSWLTSDIENQKLMNLLQKIWDSPEGKHKEPDLKTAWDKFAKKARISTSFDESSANIIPIPKPLSKKIYTSHRNASFFLRYAAAILIIVGACSRLEPSPKLRPPTTQSHGFTFAANSGSASSSTCFASSGRFDLR